MVSFLKRRWSPEPNKKLLQSYLTTTGKDICFMADITLDARGLSCPLPILKAQKTLRNMSVGQTLEIFSNDPDAPENFREFFQSSPHELLECVNLEGNLYRFVMKCGNAPVS
jgi:tRNA 2-thiouridine synthesizing protein A